MSKNFSSTTSVFVFGSKSNTVVTTTNRSGAPTKPNPFTFRITSNEKADHPKLPTSGQSRRSITSAVSTTKEVKASKVKLAPLYKLEDVKAHIEELEHLKKGKASESTDHEMRTTPLITREAFVAGGFQGRSTQYGVLGETLSIHSKSGIHVPVDPRLYVNTNAPFSAIVCGVQGSGKSHTVSVLLENMFIPNHDPIGSLSYPLAGLVLHYGEGGPGTRPSEAAWVGSASQAGIKPPSVHVYVSRSSLNTMKAVYRSLGEHVSVMPLLFNESELDAQAILSMMAVGSSESAPLYMQIVLSILREHGERFSYKSFLSQLEAEKKSFNPAQAAGLDQRLALLNSFMESPSAYDRSRKQIAPRFAAGRLTIIDLSDPFIDPASACGLFEIATRQFVRAGVDTGKVLVVDEAHKYLNAHKGSAGLTNALLTLTREQRHLGMRVIISTQEPTVVPPVLLDLCTVAIMHRFSSPAWWDHLARHVATDVSANEGFETVVKLKTGEALVLAPSGLGVFPDDSEAEQSSTRNGERERTNSKSSLRLSQFGRRFLLMKTRGRVTKDGGTSVLVVESDSEDESDE